MVTPKVKRTRARDEELKVLNALVWERDNSQCVVCGSMNIWGEPFVSGAHHLLTRNAHPELFLDIRCLMLLCITHHGPDADTRPFRKKLIKIMSGKPNFYLYPEPAFTMYLEHVSIEVLVDQTGALGYTPLTAAQHFAQTWFDRPRKVQWVGGTERETINTFTLVEGRATYRVEFVPGTEGTPAGYKIWRIDAT